MLRSGARRCVCSNGSAHDAHRRARSVGPGDRRAGVRRVAIPHAPCAHCNGGGRRNAAGAPRGGDARPFRRALGVFAAGGRTVRVSARYGTHRRRPRRGRSHPGSWRQPCRERAGVGLLSAYRLVVRRASRFRGAAGACRRTRPGRSRGGKQHDARTDEGRRRLGHGAVRNAVVASRMHDPHRGALQGAYDRRRGCARPCARHGRRSVERRAGSDARERAVIRAVQPRRTRVCRAGRPNDDHHQRRRASVGSTTERWICRDRPRTRDGTPSPCG